MENERQIVCLYEGPPSMKERLESLYFNMLPWVSEMVDALKERQELLETTRGHFGAVIAYDEGDRSPKLSVMVDMEGRCFVGISSSSPLETASGLYRLNAERMSAELEDFYKQVFPAAKNVKSTPVIIQEPLRVFFVAYCGNERFLRKERLKETLSGKGYFQLASSISDSLYALYLKMFRKWVKSGKGEIYVFPVQDKIRLAFGLPPISGKVEISVVTELSRFFRSELLAKCISLRSSSIAQDMKLSRPATMVLERDLLGSEIVLEKLDKLYNFYSAAIEQSIETIRSYVDLNRPEC